MNNQFRGRTKLFVFERLNKKPNEMGRSRTMNERYEKSRTCPSLKKLDHTGYKVEPFKPCQCLSLHID